MEKSMVSDLFSEENHDRHEIVMMSPRNLKPYPDNPRVNDDAVEKVANSIREFGFRSPIIVDKDMVIIAGHTRLKASKQLGLKEVPVMIADDLTDEQAKAYRLADNKTAELAYWDEDLLADELSGIYDIDMNDFGFDLMSDDDLGIGEDGEVEEVEAPEPPEEPVTKPRDIYQLGRHRLMCGDSTSQADVSKLMDGKKADMVFTDPPYGMNLDTDYSSMVSKQFKKGKTGNKYDAGVVDDFHPEMIESILKLDAKETFIWGADYFAEQLPNRNAGSWVVWDKRANGNDDIEEDESSDKMYGSCFELCWSKNRHKRDMARVKWAGIFGTETQDIKNRIHPTQKPIQLCGWFIDRFSEAGQNIVDLFGGSGSTLIACEQTNRTCYMMELDPKYCDVIVARWEALTGRKAELINGEDTDAQE